MIYNKYFISLTLPHELIIRKYLLGGGLCQPPSLMQYVPVELGHKMMTSRNRADKAQDGRMSRQVMEAERSKVES